MKPIINKTVDELDEYKRLQNNQTTDVTVSTFSSELSTKIQRSNRQHCQQTSKDECQRKHHGQIFHSSFPTASYLTARGLNNVPVKRIKIDRLKYSHGFSRQYEKNRSLVLCAGNDNGNLKYISLVTLTVQNALLGLSMRYARTRDGDMFLSSTAVLMSEILKLFICLAIVYVQMDGVAGLLQTIKTTIIQQPKDTLKVCVPSFVYVIQNNLLYVSASHLDAATYQVTYQLKILTTAVFAVFILRKELLKTQWLSLLTLVIGVVLVQLAHTDTSKVHTGPEQNHFIGFSAALTACILSGFAGIYFEKMLKGSDISVWMRNVQLSLCSIPFGLLTCYGYDGAIIRQHGFFFGYDKFVQYLIILQASGGLIVALVVKYADNILKGFATSLAIVISCIASIYLFNFVLTAQFALGAIFVIFSIFLYGYVPKKTSITGSRV